VKASWSAYADFSKRQQLKPFTPGKSTSALPCSKTIWSPAAEVKLGCRACVKLRRNCPAIVGFLWPPGRKTACIPAKTSPGRLPETAAPVLCVKGSNRARNSTRRSTLTERKPNLECRRVQDHLRRPRISFGLSPQICRRHLGFKSSISLYEAGNGQVNGPPVAENVLFIESVTVTKSFGQAEVVR
jgi:hypothetical protein